MAALEYAANARAVVLGKPAPDFFKAALPAPKSRQEAVMVGDDAEADVAGALAGIGSALLVRTGKYRPGDERGRTRPKETVANLAAAEAGSWSAKVRK
jgi:ribonucleotide monophosphatase NagD (HAD superfamily)